MRTFIKHILLPFMITSAMLHAREFSQSRSMGMSDALRGSVALNEGLYLNPASFAFTNKYSLEAQVSLHQGAQLYNASVVDTKTSSLGAGVAYTRMEQSVGISHNYIHGALASKFDRLGVGLGTVYEFSDQVQKWDFNVGGLVEVYSRLHLGMNGVHLLSKSSRELGAGIQVNFYDLLFLSADASKVLVGKSYDIRGGAEIVHLSSGVSFRAGSHFNTEDRFKSFSLGTGWSMHKVALMYGYQRELDVRESLHTLSLRIFF
ncbi:MAG: hypothetical protein HYS98_01660 [Deltaproteobacteria bacterium]|nr:hypothetical protein [Deltaproteobacteria bacterium]